MEQSKRSARKVTRKDVAERAGVSVAVVTYTLTGSSPVAPATAERVRAAVRELGYHPNLAAVALKSGSTSTLALISPDEAEHQERINPFFSSFFHAVSAAAEEQGYALLSTTTRPDGAELAQRLRSIAARQVDGVLVVAGYTGLDPAALSSAGVPWLELNGSGKRPGIDSIGVDLYGGARAAVEHLVVTHGHRRVGFVGRTEVDELRRIGWLDACARHGAEATTQIEVSYTVHGGYEAGVRIALDEGRPSAIFVISDFTAIGLMRAFHEHGIRVPEDVAVVSFDDSWTAEFSWPPLSSVRQPARDMAAFAVSRVLDRTAEPDFTQFPVELIVRASCGCP